MVVKLRLAVVVVRDQIAATLRRACTVSEIGTDCRMMSCEVHTVPDAPAIGFGHLVQPVSREPRQEYVHNPVTEMCPTSIIRLSDIVQERGAQEIVVVHTLLPK